MHNLIHAVFGSWHRYFCQFRKKEIAGKKIKQVKFIPVGHQGHVREMHVLDAELAGKGGGLV